MTETLSTLKPMLAKTTENERVFLKDDAFAIEEKLDGVRLLVTVENGTVRAANRRGETTKLPVKVVADFDLMVATGGTWAFDGELIDGELWLFDMPAANDLVTATTPFAIRREALRTVHAAWEPAHVKLVASAITTEDKIALVEKVREAGGEGVMVKRMAGKYGSGKRSADVLKVKFWKSVDAVVIETGRDGKANAVLGLYDCGMMVDVGAVTCIGKGKELIAVGDVVEIKYLYCVDPAAPRLYQPAVLRTRTDKAATECTIDQLEYTFKEPVTL